MDAIPAQSQEKVIREFVDLEMSLVTKPREIHARGLTDVREIESANARLSHLREQMKAWTESSPSASSRTSEDRVLHSISIGGAKIADYFIKPNKQLIRKRGLHKSWQGLLTIWTSEKLDEIRRQLIANSQQLESFVHFSLKWVLH